MKRNKPLDSLKAWYNGAVDFSDKVYKAARKKASVPTRKNSKPRSYAKETARLEARQLNTYDVLYRVAATLCCLIFIVVLLATVCPAFSPRMHPPITRWLPTTSPWPVMKPVPSAL